VWQFNSWPVVRWLRRRFLKSDSRLTRFIFSRNDFNASNRVKPRIFMPQPDGTVLVFSIDGLHEPHIWSIGANLTSEGRNLHGRADIMSSSVIAHGLRIVSDEPPPRHRNIVGWPPAEQKEDRKLIALQLAASATLRLP
jgi:hypothetical protein